MNPTVVIGAFDNVRSRQLRLLQEAAAEGAVRVALCTDDLIESLTGSKPRFPYAERRYFVEALRFVGGVHPFSALEKTEAGSAVGGESRAAVVVDSGEPQLEERCHDLGMDCVRIPADRLEGFPDPSESHPVSVGSAPPKKVLVTGCYDWLHSGHVRFFEEVSALGELIVVVGNDANVRHLKGEGHPMFPEQERRYMVQAMTSVGLAVVSTGSGWMDAAPEVKRLRPDIYAVNEDGDRPEKREYCARHNIEYRVLKRLPKAGLPARQSTHLRGF